MRIVSEEDPAGESGATHGDPALRGTTGSKLMALLRIVRVRLRMVVVFAIAFLIVGRWSVLRTYWERFAPGASSRENQAVSSDTEYWCPMDPGVLSDWPAKCPVCNMNLVRRSKAELAPLPDGVLARMQFSPYRVQLAGIRTTPVEHRPLVYKLTGMGEVRVEDGGERRFQGEFAPRDAAKLHAGQSAELSIGDAPTEKPLIGRVVAVERIPERTAVVAQIEIDSAPPDFAAGTPLTVSIQVPAIETPALAERLAVGEAGTAKVLCVPETAVIDNGRQKIVYVENSPGMFDAVEVKLAERTEGYYPVVSGLTDGQRVAAAGAFLIDAETQLNPSVAAAYFGATGQSTGKSPPPLTKQPAKAPSAKELKEIAAALAELSPADRKFAERQKNCPVTGLPLGSMGKPPQVTVEGQTVFLCCKGCEARLRKDPKKYLDKLSHPADQKP